jgi:hypothetical protein
MLPAALVDRPDGAGVSCATAKITREVPGDKQNRSLMEISMIGHRRFRHIFQQKPGTAV